MLSRSSKTSFSRSVALAACQIGALAWFCHVMLAAALVVFRAIKTAGIAGAFQFDDVPLLRHFDAHYGGYYELLALTGAGTVTGWIAGLWWRLQPGIPLQRGWVAGLTKPRRAAVGCAIALFLFEACVLTACFPLGEFDAAVSSVQPIAALDWAAVAALAVWAWLSPAALTAAVPRAAPVPRGDAPGRWSNWIVRNGGFYLLGSLAVFLYALQDHLKFWDPEANGGYNYRPFFAEGEIEQAELVMYSTSVLFASLAAIGACALIGAFRWTLRSSGRSQAETPNPLPPTLKDPLGRDDGRLFTLLAALSWAAMFSIPWEIKIWPEIAAERGWILPAVTLVFAVAGLAPMLHIGWLALTGDFAGPAGVDGGGPLAPRRSELAVWNFALFPISPVLSLLRPLGRGWLTFVATLSCGAVVARLTQLVYQVETWYRFDDWRGMMRSGLFPFLRVAFALLCAAFAYVALRRLLLLLQAGLRLAWERAAGPVGDWFVRGTSCLVLLLSLGSLGLASWPFWGWDGVNENVFARLAEFSSRHDFELRFLHWMFDFDRDGYAAVLHGADPDDFDPSVQPGYIDPPEDENPVPIDEFAVADVEKARSLPNVLLLFLEGVAPRAVGAYGRRSIDGTPHIDSVAREGTIFTQCRCFYPSTWDAWYSTLSGRYLRIQEMDTSRGFGDRYCRYNNLYKVLKLAGIDRWCHADTEPFYDMLVSYDMRRSRKTAWEPHFDSNVSTEEERRGVWRGDKRNRRILEFLDSIRPGERFFVTEHMSDTHFPWKEVPGKEWCAGDAVLDNGTTDVKYARYFETIAKMDDQVGAILQKLKQRRLYDDTIVIIVSDHGCQWWEHEHMYYVSHLYDQSLLVPLIVKIPPRLIGTKIERKVTEPVLQIDILPTIMELAGVVHTNPRDDYPFECHSLLPLIRGTATEEQRRQFWERDVPLTTHYDKLGVISRFHYKLIFNRPVGTYKLFDLFEDPREMVNLADARPRLLQKMIARLREQIHRNPAVIGGIKRGKHLP